LFKAVIWYPHVFISSAKAYREKDKQAIQSSISKAAGLSKKFHAQLKSSQYLYKKLSTETKISKKIIDELDRLVSWGYKL
jgi:glutamine synthetase adenylyltransferase